MAGVIDCKIIAEEILTEARAEVEKIVEQTGEAPRLAVIIVGNDPASQVYVRNKIRRCEAVGIESTTLHFSEEMTEDNLICQITALNHDKDVHGILVQMPLPKHINEDKIINTIHPDKDVDGLHPQNQARLLNNVEPRLDPCTPAGVMRILNHVHPEGVEGKHAVVIGRSRLFGKPMAQLLQNANATVTVCHSRTVGIECHMWGADIAISAIGSPHKFDNYHFMRGTTIIDVGINRLEDGKIVGDINTESVLREVPDANITPVPGGVGILTTAMLMLNTIKAYKIQKGE